MNFKCPVCNAEYPQNVEKCEICSFTDKLGIGRTFPLAEDAESWLNSVVKPYREKWHEKIKEKGGETVSGTAQPKPAQPVPKALKYVRAGKGILITGYAGEAPELDIPGSIESLPVVAIGEEAFYLNRTLRKVVLPEGLKSIGAYAFASCSSLESVSLPASLEEIGDYSFCKYVLFGKVCNIAMSRKTTVRDNSFCRKCKIYYYD